MKILKFQGQTVEAVLFKNRPLLCKPFDCKGKKHYFKQPVKQLVKELFSRSHLKNALLDTSKYSTLILVFDREVLCDYNSISATTI